MKRILFFLLLLISFEGFGQVKQKPVTYGVQYRRVQADSAMRMPTVTIGIKDAYAGFDTAQFRYNKTDSTVKVYTGSQWIDVVRASGSGTVTSVGLSMPSIFSVSGSPVTGSGTLAASLATQAANLVFAGPFTGAAAVPTFRALAAADFPAASPYSLQTVTDQGSTTTNDIGINIDPTANFHLSGTAKFDLGSDATGDVFYRNASGFLTRLPVGSNGQVLTLASGLPSWTTPSSGSPAGNFGNLQIGRNSAFATPASDSLDFESATGLTVVGQINSYFNGDQAMTMQRPNTTGTGSGLRLIGETGGYYVDLLHLTSRGYGNTTTFRQGEGLQILAPASSGGSVGIGDPSSIFFKVVAKGYGATGAVTQMYAGNAAYIPLSIQGAASQTADLTQWQNSSGTPLSVVTSSGSVGIGTPTPAQLLSVGSSSQFTVNTTGAVVANGSLVGSSSFDLANTVSTTLNIGGAATTMTIGGTPTTAVTHNYSTNATATATTKTVNIGTGGASGSTTNINIGGVNGGAVTINSRHLQRQGADVASANNLALGYDGNTFEITGSTSIQLISNLGWQNGSIIYLIFNEALSVNSAIATSGTNITIQLAGGADFEAFANSILGLVLSENGGTQAWREISRSVN